MSRRGLCIRVMFATFFTFSLLSKNHFQYWINTTSDTNNGDVWYTAGKLVQNKGKSYPTTFSVTFSTFSLRSIPCTVSTRSPTDMVEVSLDRSQWVGVPLYRNHDRYFLHFLPRSALSIINIFATFYTFSVLRKNHLPHYRPIKMRLITVCDTLRGELIIV